MQRCQGAAARPCRCNFGLSLLHLSVHYCELSFVSGLLRDITHGYILLCRPYVPIPSSSSCKCRPAASAPTRQAEQKEQAEDKVEPSLEDANPPAAVTTTKPSVKGLLAELFSSEDLQEAVCCLRELADSGEDMATVVESLITVSLEGKGTSWPLLSELLLSGRCACYHCLQSISLRPPTLAC